MNTRLTHDSYMFLHCPPRAFADVPSNPWWGGRDLAESSELQGEPRLRCVPRPGLIGCRHRPVLLTKVGWLRRCSDFFDLFVPIVEILWKKPCDRWSMFILLLQGFNHPRCRISSIHSSTKAVGGTARNPQRWGGGRGEKMGVSRGNQYWSLVGGLEHNFHK